MGNKVVLFFGLLFVGFGLLFGLVVGRSSLEVARGSNEVLEAFVSAGGPLESADPAERDCDSLVVRYANGGSVDLDDLEAEIETFLVDEGYRTSFSGEYRRDRVDGLDADMVLIERPESGEGFSLRFTVFDTDGVLCLPGFLLPDAPTWSSP